MRTISLFVGVLLLGGCGNLQTHITDQRSYIGIPNADMTDGMKASLLKNCPLYSPPKPALAPSAPVTEFKQLKLNQHDKREDVLITYIEQLRVHIGAMNRENEAAYTKYIKNCMSE